MTPFIKLIEQTELSRSKQRIAEGNPSAYFKTVVETALFDQEKEFKPSPQEQELIAKLLQVLRKPEHTRTKRIIKRNLAGIQTPVTPFFNLKLLHESI